MVAEDFDLLDAGVTREILGDGAEVVVVVVDGGCYDVAYPDGFVNALEVVESGVVVGARAVG